jgi:peptidoglycan hydrolase-like protein with peptidoglycan-binding domain
MKRTLTAFSLLLFLAAAPAEEQTRATQEELRRRNIYFGDIDGRPSQELSEAVKRYQRRKGLPDSGHADHATLRSLGLAAREPGEPAPKELEWPEEPVLKSDARIDVQEAIAELVAETGVAPESLKVAPPVNETKAHGAKSATPRPQARTSSSTREPSRRRLGAQRLSVDNRVELPRQISKFVESYVKAVGRNKLEDELAFYSDTVNYFGSGAVDRRIVEQTLRKYYQRWPHRSYRVVKPIGWQAQPKRGEVAVSFRVNFTLRGRSGKVRGVTENRIVINAATADPRIVSISERRVRQ